MQKHYLSNWYHVQDMYLKKLMQKHFYLSIIMSKLYLKKLEKMNKIEKKKRWQKLGKKWNLLNTKWLSHFLPHHFKPLSDECKIETVISIRKTFLSWSYYTFFAAIYKKAYELLKNIEIYFNKWNTLNCDVRSLVQEGCFLPKFATLI